MSREQDIHEPYSVRAQREKDVLSIIGGENSALKMSYPEWRLVEEMMKMAWDKGANFAKAADG